MGYNEYNDRDDRNGRNEDEHFGHQFDKRDYERNESYDRENRRAGARISDDDRGLSLRDSRFGNSNSNFRNQNQGISGGSQNSREGSPWRGDNYQREYFNEANRRAYANGYSYRQDNEVRGRDQGRPGFSNDENPRHDFAGQHSYFPNQFDGQRYPADANRAYSPGRTEFGPHSGKGPRSFKRSDERLQEDINERLTHDSHIDASDIDVRVSGGIATLTGTVDSKHAKRHAEDIADSVSGVKEVINELRLSKSQGIASSPFGRPDGGFSNTAH